MEVMRFHTAIASMMEFVNAASEFSSMPKQVASSFVLLLAPFAPHISEELWQMLGKEKTLAYEAWPVADPALLVEDSAVIAVQVNGKLKGTFEIAKGTAKGDMESAARKLDKVILALSAGEPKKVIVVPDKLVNFVI